MTPAGASAPSAATTRCRSTFCGVRAGLCGVRDPRSSAPRAEDAPGYALVRARVREDLEAFCARTGAPPPRETPERDYRFRTSVPFPVLAAELARQAAAIDYPNFKDAVAARQGYERARR